MRCRCGTLVTEAARKSTNTQARNSKTTNELLCLLSTVVERDEALRDCSCRVKIDYVQVSRA
jgi:hypothetical protein